MPRPKNFILSIAFFISFFLSAQVSSVWAQSVAFTFDDGPNLEETPRLSSSARNQAMLDALAKHSVKATLFVTVNYGANQSAGLELARAWGPAGHAIGNHTMSHPDLNSATLSLAQYQQELLACDRVISTLPGYQRWFRFPYLREGNTLEKRDGMRLFMKQEGYRNAYVSLDTSDWRLKENWLKCSKGMAMPMSPRSSRPICRTCVSARWPIASSRRNYRGAISRRYC